MRIVKDNSKVNSNEVSYYVENVRKVNHGSMALDNNILIYRCSLLFDN